MSKYLVSFSANGQVNAESTDELVQWIANMEAQFKERGFSIFWGVGNTDDTNDSDDNVVGALTGTMGEIKLN